jgi:hypothetical protein
MKAGGEPHPVGVVHDDNEVDGIDRGHPPVLPASSRTNDTGPPITRLCAEERAFAGALSGRLLKLFSLEVI